MFGRIQRSEDITKFELSMDLSEGRSIRKSFYANTRDLDEHPSVYKSILDMLTLEIENMIKRNKYTP